MSLIILNDYTPPAPTTYSVDYEDVNGEDSTLEDGYTYVEQVRADVPEIKVGWTNLTQEQATAITDIMANDTVVVQYFYGSMKVANMRKGSRSLKLKFIDDNGGTYWDLSFTLKG